MGKFTVVMASEIMPARHVIEADRYEIDEDGILHLIGVTAAANASFASGMWASITPETPKSDGG